MFCTQHIFFFINLAVINCNFFDITLESGFQVLSSIHEQVPAPNLARLSVRDRNDKYAGMLRSKINTRSWAIITPRALKRVLANKSSLKGASGDRRRKPAHPRKSSRWERGFHFSRYPPCRSIAGREIRYRATRRRPRACLMPPCIDPRRESEIVFHRFLRNATHTPHSTPSPDERSTTDLHACTMHPATDFRGNAIRRFHDSAIYRKELSDVFSRTNRQFYSENKMHFEHWQHRFILLITCQ